MWPSKLTRLDATPDDVAVRVVGSQVDVSLHEQVVIALAHRSRVCPLAHEQLEGGKQRRLAGTRLAREHGETGGGTDRRVTDEGHALDVELVDHGWLPPWHMAAAARGGRDRLLLLLAHLPVEDARHRVIEPAGVRVEQDDVAGSAANGARDHLAALRAGDELPVHEHAALGGPLV